jgi:cell division protein ZapE
LADTSVSQLYEAALTERGFTADPAQLAAVTRLDQCCAEWIEFKEQRSNAIKRLINRPEVPRGVYLYGGVGRGQELPHGRFF